MTTISGQLRRPTPAQGTNTTKIHIATPAYQDTFKGAYVSSLYRLLNTLTAQGIATRYSTIDYADVVVARNYLVSHFYFNKADCSHLLFIDNDMGFPSELITDMLALNQGVVGCIYPKRSIDLQKLHAAGSQNTPYPRALAQSLNFIYKKSAISTLHDKFMTVERVGTGILLIRRDVITQMMQESEHVRTHQAVPKLENLTQDMTHFIRPFDKITLDDGTELSEDYSFCHRWTHECSGTIWASIAHPISHVGQMTFTGQWLDTLDD